MVRIAATSSRFMVLFIGAPTFLVFSVFTNSSDDPNVVRSRTVVSGSVSP